MPSQVPIKIDKNLFDNLNTWLQTKDAKNKGFHSKAQFATEAIRELLDQNTGKKLSYSDLMNTIKQQIDLLKDIKKKQEKFERLWFKQNIPGLIDED